MNSGLVHLRHLTRITMKLPVVFLFVAAMFMACNGNDVDNNNSNAANGDNPPPPLIGYAVVNTFPHDTLSFTEGLMIHDGQLYESTGSPEDHANNGSWFGKIDMVTGKQLN